MIVAEKELDVYMAIIQNKKITPSVKARGFFLLYVDLFKRPQ